MIKHKIKRIQSKLLKTGTYVCKISLSCFDDKRYILNDGINSLAYFNKKSLKWIKSIEPLESIELIKSSQSNKVNKKVVLIKNCKKLFLFSSIYIEETKTKFYVYF